LGTSHEEVLKQACEEAYRDALYEGVLAKLNTREGVKRTMKEIQRIKQVGEAELMKAATEAGLPSNFREMSGIEIYNHLNPHSREIRKNLALKRMRGGK
jgi:hypothetical protein